MGVRVYNPATGRFLQTDPILGGNDNPYVYPSDPINSVDLDGRRHEVGGGGGGGGEGRGGISWRAKPFNAKSLRGQGRQPSTKGGARREPGSGKMYRSPEEARHAAHRYAGKHKSCDYRDVCSARTHVHVDKFVWKKGKKIKVHTRHYYWPV